MLILFLPLFLTFLLIGLPVFFGMLGVTVFGLIFTPVFYVVMRGLPERLRKVRTRVMRRKDDAHPPLAADGATS